METCNSTMRYVSPGNEIAGWGGCFHPHIYYSSVSSKNIMLFMNAWIERMSIFTQWNIAQPQEKWKFAICSHMGGNGDHCVMQSKAGTQRQMPHACPHGWK